MDSQQSGERRPAAKKIKTEKVKLERGNSVTSSSGSPPDVGAPTADGPSSPLPPNPSAAPNVGPTAAPAPDAGTQASPGGDRLTVTIVDRFSNEEGNEVQYRVRYSTTLGKLLQVFCTKHAIQESTVWWFPVLEDGSLGSRLSGQRKAKTFSQLGYKAQVTIEARRQQDGGAWA